MADLFEAKARELLPQIYDLAQGRGVASTLVIAIAQVLRETAEAERKAAKATIDILEDAMNYTRQTLGALNEAKDALDGREHNEMPERAK